MKTLFYDSLLRDLESFLDPIYLNEWILDTLKTVENSILSVGLNLVKIRDNRLYEMLGYKNMSAYVRYLVNESQKDRSSIYKWLQIGEVYIKYREKLMEIGFSSKNGLMKLPYLEKALENKPHKEVYENIMNMKHGEFSRYARSIVDKNISETEEKTEGETELIEEEYCFTYIYRGEVAVKVYKSLGENGLEKMHPAVRLAFNMLERGTYVLAVHLNTAKEWKLFTPIAVKAREELQKRIK